MSNYRQLTTFSNVGPAMLSFKFDQSYRVNSYLYYNYHSYCGFILKVLLLLLLVIPFISCLHELVTCVFDKPPRH